MKKLILLDGNQRSALSITRSLGKKGITIIAGDEKVPSLSSCSKYCFQSFSYPSPYKKPDAFIQSIRTIINNYKDSLLIPVTDVTLSEILRNRALFKDLATIPFVEYTQYASVSDKVNLFHLAHRLNIPIPKTLFPSELNDIGTIMEESKKVGFPLVIKPFSSRIRTKNEWTNAKISYVNSAHELENLLKGDPFKGNPFLIQERIVGPGIGIFLLLHEDKVIAHFAHKRIRERPPSGGVSVVCESIPPPPDALQAARRLLEELKWSGVAMVEFKWDRRDNLPKLIEINARFWGSLQLAVSAGVDFPYLLYCVATGREIKAQTNYKTGIKSRWELGDLDHLLARMLKKQSSLHLPPDAASRWEVMKSFIFDSLRPSIRNEVLRLDDPRPFLSEVRHYLKSLFHSAE